VLIGGAVDEELPKVTAALEQSNSRQCKDAIVYFLVLRWPIIKLIQSLQRLATRHLANKTASTEKDPSALPVQ
jgi:hypothetical protein